jgi:hypothetical protein
MLFAPLLIRIALPLIRYFGTDGIGGSHSGRCTPSDHFVLPSGPVVMENPVAFCCSSTDFTVSLFRSIVTT